MSKVMLSTDMDMENKSLLSLKKPKKHRTPHTIISKKIKIMGSELVFSPIPNHESLYLRCLHPEGRAILPIIT